MNEDSHRPAPYPADNEMMGDIHDGEAPRPATEPHGSEGTSNSGETATDPATGAPNDGQSPDDADRHDRERQDPEQISDPDAAQEEAARQREEEGGYQ
jgi:hypothetical protein